MSYDPNKIEKMVYLQLTPEFQGSFLRNLSLTNATSRPPKAPQGLVVRLNLRLDRRMFQTPMVDVDVTDSRVQAEAEVTADAVS